MRTETPDPWVRRSRSGRRCASLHCALAPGDHAATMRAPGRYRAAACTSASRSMSENSSRVYPRLSDSTASCRLTPLIARQSDAAHTPAMATRERRRSASTTARRATRSNVTIQRTATARGRWCSTWLATITSTERGPSGSREPSATIIARPPERARRAAVRFRSMPRDVSSRPWRRGLFLTLDAREDAFEYRDAVLRVPEADAIEAVRVVLREPPRDRFLVRREHVQHEAWRGPERGIHVVLLIHRHDNQGWLERHRSDRARRHADRAAGGVAGGQDGHAGREATEQLAELSGVDAGHIVTTGIGPRRSLSARDARGRCSRSRSPEDPRGPGAPPGGALRGW